MKDANVLQVDELYRFANGVSNFSSSMVTLCNQMASSADEARAEANNLRHMMMNKVDNIRAELEKAQNELSNYLSKDHRDSQGRSTYNASYVQSLRNTIADASRRLEEARRDLELVQLNYYQILHLVDELQSKANTYSGIIRSAGDETQYRVNKAAQVIDHEYMSK